MPRCSLIRQMKGLQQTFHLPYRWPSTFCFWESYRTRGFVRFFRLHWNISESVTKCNKMKNMLTRMFPDARWYGKWKVLMRAFICSINDRLPIIRAKSVTSPLHNQCLFFQKKVVTSDFFFFPEYWQQALDAASESRQSGLSFAASMTCYRSRRDPQDFFQKYFAMGHARFGWFCFRKWCDPLQHAMVLLLAGLSADGRWYCK